MHFCGNNITGIKTKYIWTFKILQWEKNEKKRVQIKCLIELNFFCRIFIKLEVWKLECEIIYLCVNQNFNSIYWKRLFFRQAKISLEKRVNFDSLKRPLKETI